MEVLVTCPSLCHSRSNSKVVIPKHNFEGRDESIRVIVKELHNIMLGTKIIRNFMQGQFSLDVSVYIEVLSVVKSLAFGGRLNESSLSLSARCL
jgi:hypothetical protein